MSDAQPAQQQELQQRLADKLQPLEAASSGRFLPTALHMQVLRSLRGVLGERAYREFSARTVSAALDEPLMFAKPARAALRALGSSRWLMLRALPVSFRFIFADVGPVRVEIAHDDSHAIIVHERCTALTPLDLSGLRTRGCLPRVRDSCVFRSRRVLDWLPTFL